MNPIATLIEQRGHFVLDGGLATALEAKGHDLDDPLWSARLLIDDPASIREVHSEFLVAGADCITSATYQATLAGFGRRGLPNDQAAALLRRAVALAVEARDAFWADPSNRIGRVKPIVAASVGPYGAFLADGSEYTGKYDIDARGLYAFHRERWQILSDAGAEVLACETIPSQEEGAVLLRLIDETPGAWAWMSFSCSDEISLRDSSPLSAMAMACEGVRGVAAVGINCTAPQFVSSLIEQCRRRTSKPIIVYPNSGERYLPESGAWSGAACDGSWGELAKTWVKHGAAGVGGCCRVGPEHIAEIRKALS